MFIYVHVYIVCQGYTPRVLTKYSIFIRNNTTQAHQNEKICQQSTFLTFIIYGHTLSLSLLLSFFFFRRIRSFFAFFGAWVSSLCLGRHPRNIIPPKQTPQAAFSPAHTQVSETFHRENSSLSLSLSFAERCLFLPFSFLAEDIYIYIYILLLSLFGSPRKTRARRKNHHRGDDPFF